MSRSAPAVLLALLGALALAPQARGAESGADVALASQAAARATAVSPPVIFAPANVSAVPDQAITIQADATDPDQGDVLTITQSGAPASLLFSHVPSASPASATLSGTLGAGDLGTHQILWEVTDGTFTSSATTALSVVSNQDPVVTAPANVLGAETVPLSVTATVSDPDGDPINSITAAPLPAGATFTPNALLTNGQLEWTPALGQMGVYTVVFTAGSGSPERTGTATTVLNIGPQDRRPVVTAPGSVTTVPSVLLTINVTASDPDGQPITSLQCTGTQSTPLPAGASFSANATNTAGSLTWTPTPAQTGTYNVEWAAVSGALGLENVLTVTRIVVRVDRAPVVTAPATVNGTEGAPIAFNVTVSDPDATPILSLSTGPLPFGASFVAAANNASGTFSWTPDFFQAGTNPVVFTASNALSGSATTQIVVANQNRNPTADANGPYAGVAGIAIAFNGSGSSDPDGDALSYLWDFGDLSTGAGAMPSHIYAAGGVYNVSLTVTDNGAPPLSGSSSTTATVAAALEARAFTYGGNKAIRLSSNKPTWCAQVEPVDGNFNLSEVLPNSLVLKYGGSQISAGAGKGTVIGDKDENGIEDMDVCFGKEDLRTLFAGLPAGKNTVMVTVEGSLMSGANLSGEVEVDVFATGGSSLAASVTPNPFNPEGTLSFVTKRPGALRVRLFDMNGRLVRTLADQSSAAAGYHDIRIDGRGENGIRLASGVYFFRIETADGHSVGRISILK